MAQRYLTHLDGAKIAELQNFLLHNVAAAPSTPGLGQAWFNTVSDRPEVKGTSAVLVLAALSNKITDFAAPTTALAMNSQKITGLADPTAAQDAATKAYVDSVAAGLDPKQSVKAASTGNLTLSGAQTIDGVSCGAGDRVLVKDQSTASQNGIYVVAAGAWSRATDADVAAELTGGHYVFVEQGTVYADTGWVCTVDGTPTVGSTDITYAQFSGAGTILGGAGLVKTGATIDVVAAAGSGIVVNPDNVDIDPVNGLPVNRGGTGAITAAGAKTNLGFVTKYAATIGNGSSTSIAVTHSLGTRDVLVSVHDASTFAEVECDVTKTDTNTVTLGFLVAPASNSLRATVIG